MEHMYLSTIDRMVEDLRRSFGGVRATQDQISKVTGTAWSDDHLIKVVVGPRGQLIGLEIDPRAVRRVNTEALAATILATARAEADDAFGRTQGLVERDMPDMRAAFGQGVPTPAGLASFMFGHDADLVDTGRKDDGEHGE